MNHQVKYQSPLASLLRSQKDEELENRLIQVINDIDRRLHNLEERVGKIPDPFVLYYRPPGEGYKKINEVLDDIHARINTLEIVQGV